MSFDALLQKLCVGRAEDACINVRQASMLRARARAHPHIYVARGGACAD
jgi:hypothetical protein